MLDKPSEKLDEDLEPKISIIITSEQNDLNLKSDSNRLKQYKTNLKSFNSNIQLNENNLSSNKRFLNHRKCLSRLNLNVSNHRDLQKNFDSPQKTPELSQKFILTPKKSLNNNICKNISSICLNHDNMKSDSFQKNMDKLDSNYLSLKSSNSNIFKSSNSLNALDLEGFDTYSIGSFDRYSCYSLYSNYDQENQEKSVSNMKDNLNIQISEQHLNYEKSIGFNSKLNNKVINWLEKN
ncbi:unnamed protein product [Brachionus calyciflorus]|uniref:Uncharacterized protein n=1 Tax=Brachionus calyciflorus TaxID=104777 RepID=A0A813MBG9_9BILA|nr:unnamed protein product [Brachionus calyciflorus]